MNADDLKRATRLMEDWKKFLEFTDVKHTSTSE